MKRRSSFGQPIVVENEPENRRIDARRADAPTRKEIPRWGELVKKSGATPN